MEGMNIYFSGIGGVGLGPLAELAHDAGHRVLGSDSHIGLETQELERRGISVSQDQTGEYLAYRHQQTPIDWFIYTAALPPDHPELVLAHRLGIYTAKRDELLTYLINEKDLQLIAIAGTHGKTTTTGLMVWALRQLGEPVSYSVGTTLSFGPSGHYVPGSRYFVYECDEFDRNFLQFHPYLTLLTSVDYDHPDTYPTKQDYTDAFSRFLEQSEYTIMWQRDADAGVVPPRRRARVLEDEDVQQFTLAGAHNRANATLVATACKQLRLGSPEHIRAAINTFPGVQRRFERLGTGLYSDYGHHPVEIAATLQMARELSDHVVLVYQPHQNVRQHEIRQQYTDCMERAEQIYWLPTYLSREDSALPILTPQQLTEQLTNRSNVHCAELDDTLWHAIQTARAEGKLVLCMGAGTIDGWVRQHLGRGGA